MEVIEIAFGIFIFLILLLALAALVAGVFSLLHSIAKEIKEEKAKAKTRECEGGCKFKKSYTCACNGDCIEGIDKKYACPYWESCAECVYLVENFL